MEGILEYVQGIIYDTDIEECPVAFSGTCFPIRWGDALYLVSAKHCFENIETLNTDRGRFYYYLPQKKTDAVRCSVFYDVKAECGSLSEKYQDIIIAVPDEQDRSIQDISQIQALDISNPTICCDLDLFDQNRFPSQDIKDRLSGIIIKGFPYATREINYDECNIRMRGVRLEDCVEVRRSEFNMCYYLRFDNPTFFIDRGGEHTLGCDANGFSGAPVYFYNKINHAICLLGMIIEYNTLSEEFLVISSRMIYLVMNHIILNISELN